MGALEKVNELKQQGMNDSQIISSLKSQGYTPKDIGDALSQHNIKSAVNTENQYSTQNPNEMIPSSTNEDYSNPPQNEYSQNQNYPQENYPSQDPYFSQSQEYPQQGYAQEEYYEDPYAGYSNTENFEELATQIIEEKTNNLKKQITTLETKQNRMLTKINSVEKRLTEIENIIKELQISIIRKVGEYGENINNIANEMHQTQDNFSKLINPLLDKKRKTTS